MEEQEQNRTEQATPFKLAEARKRGQVAKSLEINTLVMISGLLVVMSIAGATCWQALCDLCGQLFASSAVLQFAPDSTPGLLREMATRAIDAISGIVLVGVAAAIIANVVQTGFIFSAEPIKPKWEHLNPVTGVKRIFNKRMLFEAFKGLVKLLFLGWIAYAFFINTLPALLSVGANAVDGQAKWLAAATFSLIFRLVIGLAIVALIDVAFVRLQYSRRMMMSRRELKEEVKRREGDPQIRSKLRELQRENLKQARSLGRLPDADVLITNPTHLAVALRYDRNTMQAPIVLAKGADHWVAEMKSVARQYGVPIMERRTLARLLFRRGVLERPIPAESFLEVARVYAELEERRRSQARYEVVRQ